ncbi:enoyl-CoA hydratase/isomerase family protein [Flavicella marina]|uniref:enoyl-CoA hydratase/isomerase family protein n=1 Tax=Flavicella marina TaxID=1475951 RepID=UPI001264C3CA|nr:enoyl-CoA hydratase/isomerase family protein [Flavicella marina]
MELGTIHTKIENSIAEVVFHHPASNSFPSTLLRELTQKFKELSVNDAVKVVLLRSEGEKAFCGGASFDELLTIKDKETGIAFFMGFANLINAIRTCKKIVIGCVQGKAVGGGVGLASACDYALATEAAAIKLSEFFIGIGAFVIEPAVSRKIGKSAFCQLSLEATEWHSATWAQEKNLYAKVFSNQQIMLEEANKLAVQLAGYNPYALAEMKKVFWDGTENWDVLLSERAQISGDLVLSDFTKEALTKFKK